MNLLEESKVFKFITIIINIGFGILFPLSVIGAMVSPMTFDAPGSMKSFHAWVFFLSTFSLPIIILIAATGSLIFLFKKKSYKKAFWLSLLPVINLVVIFFIYT